MPPDSPCRVASSPVGAAEAQNKDMDTAIRWMVTASSASKGRLSQGSLVEGDTEESQVVSRVAVATKTISSIIIQQN